MAKFNKSLTGIKLLQGLSKAFDDKTNGGVKGESCLTKAVGYAVKASNKLDKLDEKQTDEAILKLQEARSDVFEYYYNSGETDTAFKAAFEEVVQRIDLVIQDLKSKKSVFKAIDLKNKKKGRNEKLNSIFRFPGNKDKHGHTLCIYKRNPSLFKIFYKKKLKDFLEE